MSDVRLADRQAVGTFIRQQRRSVAPGEFPQLIRRRRHVVHLTQGDLAELAGVSHSVVAQVENGRYANLSPTLVQKLCQALDLPANHQQYLMNLVHSTPSLQPSPPDEIPASVRSVVDAAEPNPAMLLNPRFDIVYWNSGATRLLTDFGKLPEGQRNVAVSMFCVPEMRIAWKNWESNARNIVAGMRMQASLRPTYRDAINDLANDLSCIDPLFAAWWKNVDPLVQPLREKDFEHPRVGLLRVYQTVSDVVGCPHLSLLVFTPRDARTAQLFREL